MTAKPWCGNTSMRPGHPSPCLQCPASPWLPNVWRGLCAFRPGGTRADRRLLKGFGASHKQRGTCPAKTDAAVLLSIYTQECMVYQDPTAIGANAIPQRVLHLLLERALVSLVLTATRDLPVLSHAGPARLRLADASLSTAAVRAASNAACRDATASHKPDILQFGAAKSFSSGIDLHRPPPWCAFRRSTPAAQLVQETWRQKLPLASLRYTTWLGTRFLS